MDCVIVVETGCCMNNCSKVEEPSIPEYEVTNSDSEEEEDVENASTKTLFD